MLARTLRASPDNAASDDRGRLRRWRHATGAGDNRATPDDTTVPARSGTRRCGGGFPSHASSARLRNRPRVHVRAEWYDYDALWRQLAADRHLPDPDQRRLARDDAPPRGR